MLFEWAVRLLYLWVVFECARLFRAGWAVRRLDPKAEPEAFEAARRGLTAAYGRGSWLLLAVMIADAMPGKFGSDRYPRFYPMLIGGSAQLAAYTYSAHAIRLLTRRQLRRTALAYLLAASVFGAIAGICLLPDWLPVTSGSGVRRWLESPFALPGLLSAAALALAAAWTGHQVRKTLRVDGDPVEEEGILKQHEAIYRELGLEPAILRWLPESATQVDGELVGLRADALGLRPSIVLGRKIIAQLSPAQIDVVLRFDAARDRMGGNARLLKRYWVFCLGVLVPGLFLLATLLLGPDGKLDFDGHVIPAFGVMACVGFVLDAYRELRMETPRTDAFMLTRFGLDPAALLALLGKVNAILGKPLKKLDDVKSPDARSRLELLGRFVTSELDPAQWLAADARRSESLQIQLVAGMALLLAGAVFRRLHSR